VQTAERPGDVSATAAKPELLTDLVAVLRLAPRTIEESRRTRLAARAFE
jgi:hypothetical protein